MVTDWVDLYLSFCFLKPKKYMEKNRPIGCYDSLYNLFIYCCRIWNIRFIKDKAIIYITHVIGHKLLKRTFQAANGYESIKLDKLLVYSPIRTNEKILCS